MPSSLSQIPNLFLCIGAQKAGTDWLWQTFSGHPEMFLTPVKEVHYFDHSQGLSHHLNDRRRRARRNKFRRKLWNPAMWRWRAWYNDYMRDPIDDEWYIRLFRHRGICAFAGEVTPEYAILGPEGFQHIQRLSPDVRILFIMREPAARAWSFANHHARRLGIALNGLTPERVLDFMKSAPHFESLGDYGRTIRTLREVFDGRQLCFSFYEEVHANRMRAIEQWCRFIGISFREDWFLQLDRRYNVTLRSEMPAELNELLREHFHPVVAEVRTLIGHVPREWHTDL